MVVVEVDVVVVEKTFVPKVLDILAGGPVVRTLAIIADVRGGMNRSLFKG